jgi:pre-mRNA-processing factor 40
MNGLPPAVGPHLSGWAQAKNEADGRFYYYNSITKQTTWEKPEELKDDVEVRLACFSHHGSLY